MREALLSEDTDPDNDEDDDSDFSDLVDGSLPGPVAGWPQLTTMMAKTPEFAAFSRFRELNIKSLLYYQSQLTHLERDLRRAEYRDSRRTRGERSKFAQRIDYLMGYKTSKQYRLITEIRQVLREYSKFCPCSKNG